MTIQEAAKKAERLAQANKKAYFVVDDFEGVDVCDEMTLDTFYLGIPENRIVYCADSWTE